MKIQFLFPSNRQTSFSLSFAKGTDPHDQVQSQTLNSHEKCKIFLQDISVTKSHLILLLNSLQTEEGAESETREEMYRGPGRLEKKMSA